MLITFIKVRKTLSRAMEGGMETTPVGIQSKEERLGSTPNTAIARTSGNL